MAFKRLVPLLALILTAGPSVVQLAAAEQSASNPSPAATAPMHGRPVVVFKEGRLSIPAQNVPLRALLAEISDQASIAIVGAESIDGDLGAVHFDNAPLEAVLRELLNQHDAFFLYGVRGKPPAAVRAIWIYPGGRGARFQPTPPESWASTLELEQQAASQSPEDRAAAIESLIARQRDRALPAVLRALRDPEDTVRTRALSVAVGKGLALPTEALQQALADASHVVRFLALEAFARRPEAREIAIDLLRDPNEHVRTRAEEILQRLDAAERRRATP